LVKAIHASRIRMTLERERGFTAQHIHDKLRQQHGFPLG
jgi:hypothetical protein